LSQPIILCASDLRFAWGQGLPSLLRLAADSGFSGIWVGSSCAQRDLPQLVAQAAGSGLSVPVAHAPLPEAPISPGRRLPHLCAPDDIDERLTAIKLVESTWTAASPLGISEFVLDLGAVTLRGEPSAIANWFSRRELDEDEAGHRSWTNMLAERRALSPVLVDACRYALDRLLPRAEAAGFSLSIEVTGPWSAPTPREAEALLDEYRGGPLSIVWDEARVQALGALGLGIGTERRAVLAKSTRVVRCHEAVGAVTGYLPGLGDPDGHGLFPLDVKKDGAETPRSAPSFAVVSGFLDSSDEEVSRARAAVARRWGNNDTPAA